MFTWFAKLLHWALPSYTEERAAVCGFGPGGPARKVVFAAA